MTAFGSWGTKGGSRNAVRKAWSDGEGVTPSGRLVQGKGVGGVGVYTMISDRKCKPVGQPRDDTYSTGPENRNRAKTRRLPVQNNPKRGGMRGWGLGLGEGTT